MFSRLNFIPHSLHAFGLMAWVFFTAQTKWSSVLHRNPVSPCRLYSAHAPQSVEITGVPERNDSTWTPQKGSRNVDGQSVALAFARSFLRSAGPTRPTY